MSSRERTLTLSGQNGLPLGQNCSFLEAIVSSYLALSTSWGLWAGDCSLSPVDGALVIEGLDTSRVAGNFSSYPINVPTAELPCPFQVTIEHIDYDTPDGISHSLLTNESTRIVACIEPYEDSLRFTSDVTSNFANITGYNDSYPLQTSPSDNIPIRNLTIILDNGYTTTIPNSELFTLKSGSDAEGQYAVVNASIVKAEIPTSSGSAPNYLSGLFLTYNYLVVDYESSTFKLGPLWEEINLRIRSLLRLFVFQRTQWKRPGFPGTRKAKYMAVSLLEFS